MNKELVRKSAQIPKRFPCPEPTKETLFDYLEKTIAKFVSNPDFSTSALVLPPCNSHFRFLIHQYVSDKFAGRLSTFSVGELNWRRTVVHGRLSRETMDGSNVKKKSLKGVLYVPPHARTEAGTANPQPDARKKKSAKNENSARMCDDSSLLFKKNDLIFKDTLNSRRWKKTKSGSADSKSKDENISNGQATVKEEVTEDIDLRGTNDEFKETETPTEELKREVTEDIDLRGTNDEFKETETPTKELRNSVEDSLNCSLETHTKDSVSHRIPHSPSDSLTVDSSDWDSLYDDSGNSRSSCFLPEIDSSSMKEIENRIGNVKIASPSDVFIFNSDFEPSEDGDTTSIIEIYGFPEEFKTNDLVNTFSNFVSRGFALKWVDNTHALGIFPSTLMADEALSANLPNVKTRPIHKGTPISREKAATLVLPSAMRPKTCSITAKRLVSSALGLKQKVSAEDREKEKKLLKEAREQRRLMVKQKEAAWDGIFFD